MFHSVPARQEEEQASAQPSWPRFTSIVLYKSGCQDKNPGKAKAIAKHSNGSEKRLHLVCWFIHELWTPLASVRILTWASLKACFWFVAKTKNFCTLCLKPLVPLTGTAEGQRPRTLTKAPRCGGRYPRQKCWMLFIYFSEGVSTLNVRTTEAI